MSNLILNFRFWYWHLQIERDTHRVWVSFNPFQWERGIGMRWFEVYR
jgi:hypothetical protein